MDWLSHLPFTHALDWLAQTPTEIDLLKSKIQFLEEANASLKDANASLAKTFDHYVNMVKLSLGVAGGVAGLVLALGAVVSIKSLKDYYGTLKTINGQVRKQVNEEITLALQVERRRFRYIETLLARESIPETIALDYLVPGAEPRSRPGSLNFLLKVLQGRGFRALLKFEPGFQTVAASQALPSLNAEVVVLDLHHAGIDRQTDAANEAIRAVAAKLPQQQATLVVYGSGRYDAINELTGAGNYCGASNNPLSLVARVLEAAYVADAIKQ